MISVKVISKEVIKPSQPTPPHLRKLQSSLFDHAQDATPMPLIFFYSPKTTPTTCNVLEQLRDSLPATLNVFYPLAGRANQDANHITCNDEGVLYVQAHVSSTCLEDTVHKADLSELDKLLPSSYVNDEGNDALPLLVIQVTSFACGGLVIGIKMSHAISDGFSLVMFIKAWADFANGKSNTSPRPYFDVWKVFPVHAPKISTNNTNGPTKPPILDLITSKPVTKWFLFSKSDCDAIRSRQCSEYNESTTASITMVLSALIWNRIKIACTSSRHNSIPHETFFAVNIRPQVKTPIVDDKSCYYFGNMIVSAMATPKDDNFIAAMKESIDRIKGRGKSSSSYIKDLQEGREDLRFMMEHFEREIKGEIVILGCSSSRSLSAVYEPDFGWGKPVWVTPGTLPYKNLVGLIPAGPSSKDTYAYITLIGDEMAELEADREFMSFVSKSAGTTFASKSKL